MGSGERERERERERESQIALGGELVQVGIFIKQGVGIWSK